MARAGQTVAKGWEDGGLLSVISLHRERARVSFLCVVFLFCGLWGGEASKHWIAICCYLEKTESKPFASGTKVLLVRGGGGLESVQSQIERAHCF